MKKETIYQHDEAKKTINVTREFAAPVEKTWRAWTESELLDQWWGPKPWKAETKSMDFSEGGTWLYAMVGPNGEKQWSKAEYTEIEDEIYFVGTDAFCDENGVTKDDFPQSTWKVEFSPVAEGTRVEVEVKFKSAADMKKLLETGFQEGFRMGHSNLDELLDRM